MKSGPLNDLGENRCSRLEKKTLTLSSIPSDARTPWRCPTRHGLFFKPCLSGNVYQRHPASRLYVTLHLSNSEMEGWDDRRIKSERARALCCIFANFKYVCAFTQPLRRGMRPVTAAWSTYSAGEQWTARQRMHTVLREVRGCWGETWGQQGWEGSQGAAAPGISLVPAARPEPALPAHAVGEVLPSGHLSRWDSISSAFPPAGHLLSQPPPRWLFFTSGAQ